MQIPDGQGSVKRETVVGNVQLGQSLLLRPSGPLAAAAAAAGAAAGVAAAGTTGSSSSSSSSRTQQGKLHGTEDAN